MARSGSLLFDDAIIGCITEGRNPTVYELFSVGARIWVDAAADRSLSDWDTLPIAEQIMVLQRAQLALCWNLPDPGGEAVPSGRTKRTHRERLHTFTREAAECGILATPPRNFAR